MTLAIDNNKAIEKVLIVAKCIVNLYSPFKLKGGLEVLIVAKCIVNTTTSNGVPSVAKY